MVHRKILANRIENKSVVFFVREVRHIFDPFLSLQIAQELHKGSLPFAADNVVDIRSRQERLRYRRSMRATCDHRNVEPFLHTRSDFEDLTVVGREERRDTDDVGPDLGYLAFDLIE